jgi:sugar lactone lactonase YvrE
MNRLLLSLSLICALFGLNLAQAQQRPLNSPAPPPSAEVAEKIARTDDVPALLSLAAGFEAKGEYNNLIATLQRVLVLRPMAGNIQYELAAAYALVNDKRHCYDQLLKMQTTGYAYDPSADERFTNARGTDAWEYIILNLQANAKPFGEGKVVATLPAEDTLIDAIAYDSTRKQMLAGSMREGAVYRVSADGKTLTPFITPDAKNQLRSVIAMQADSKRGHLWVTATGLPHFKYIADTDFGKTAIYQFDLKTGTLIKRIDMPAATGPHRLDYINIAADGRVFVADSAQKRIHQVEGNTTKLLVQNPRLTHLRGLAASDDGKLLYFADTEYGLFVLSLEQGKAVPVTAPETLTLFGIDGLYFWKGHLVAIQNAFPPARVMRMKLDAGGTRIVASMPLDAGHPAFEAPTTGALDGDALLLIANSQRPNYDRFGLPIDKSKLKGVTVWRSDLKFALDKVMSNKPIEVKKAKQ